MPFLFGPKVVATATGLTAKAGKGRTYSTNSSRLLLEQLCCTQYCNLLYGAVAGCSDLPIERCTPAGV